MIRKESKARWVYRCSPCDYTSPASADLFGAQEYEQRHRGSLSHSLALISGALQPVVEAYAEMARTIIRTSEQFQKDFALVPPPNIPHDPSLLRDRRKWGGR